MAELEREIAKAETYDVAENLINAYGYSRDDYPSPDGGTLFASQVLQPVIAIAPDNKSANVRARTLNLGGTSGAAGYWSSGSVEGQIVFKSSTWQLDAPRATTNWTAPYPGGWTTKQ